MRSPCAACKHASRDKNDPGCRDCRARVDYVTGIGAMAFSVPIEETDMAGKPFSDEEDMEIIRSMREPAGKVAERLKRAIGSIYSRRSQLRAMGREGVEPVPPKAPPKGPAPPPPPRHTRPGAISILRPGEPVLGKNNDPHGGVLNLEAYGDLLEQIKRRAREELRTWQNQAAWMLRQALQDGSADHGRSPDRTR